MGDKTQRIIEIQKDLKALDHDHRLDCGKLGADLFEKNRKNDSQKYGKMIAELNRLDEEKTAARKNITKIMDLQAREKTLTEEHKQLENQIRYLEKDNTKLFETIGKTAYNAYKSSLLRGEDFDEVFMQLSGVDDKIEHLEDRIKSSGNAGNGLIKRIGGSVSRLVFATRKNIAEGSADRLFQKSGNELIEKKLLDKVATKEVAMAVRPFYENREAIESMSAEMAALDEEMRKISAELSRLCGGIRPTAKIDGLKNKVAAVKTAMADQFAELGDSAAGSKAENLAYSAEMEDLFSAIPERKKRVRGLQAEQRKLNTQIQIEQLQAEKEKERFAITVQTDKIRQSEETIEKSESRITELEAEIAKLSKKK